MLLVILHLFIHPISLIIFLLFLLFDVILFFHLGRIRTRGLNEVANIITSIRDNKFSSSEEIVLSDDLSGLQEAIRSMYLKSRSDIETMKKLEKVRTEFLANVSHELRTPIFTIQGFIETLLDGALEDPKVNRSFLEKANHHTQNLNHLLNDLIDISMIESGEMRMSFRYFRIHELALEIISELKTVAEEKGLSLNYAGCREKLKVLGDKNKIKQVLINLVQNAIKYTEVGNIDLVIIEDVHYAEISVNDTGIGIAEKDLDRIFERFYRVNKIRSRSMGGTGLGLAIVKHILEAHGSSIEVRSNPGTGSQFTFRLKI